METFELLEIFCNVLEIIGALTLITVPVYLLNRRQTKKLTRIMEEETAIILHRINDLDNALADLKDND